MLEKDSGREEHIIQLPGLFLSIAIPSSATTYAFDIGVSHSADVLHVLLCAGVYPIPEEGALDAWAPISAPISANEPVGAGRHPFLCKPPYCIPTHALASRSPPWHVQVSKLSGND